MTRINNDNTSSLGFEIRRCQQQTEGRSLSIVIPNKFAKRMGLNRGDLLKMRLQNNRFLISERVNLEGISPDGDIIPL